MLGLILPAFGFGIPSLATVTYANADAITNVIPYGTQASPAAVTAGQTAFLQCDVASANTPPALGCSVSSSSGGLITGMTPNGHTDPYGGQEFTYNWAVPSGLSGAVTLNFTSTDTANGQSVSFLDYIYVSSTQPTGYFKINGIQVSQSSSLTVSNPSLQFDGYVTSGQPTVQNMRVVIYNSDGLQLASITLNLASGNHYGPQNFTLPAHGTYTVNGYIITSGGNFQLMSLIGNFGGSPYLAYINLLTGFGAILVVVGTVKK